MSGQPNGAHTVRTPDSPITLTVPTPAPAMTPALARALLAALPHVGPVGDDQTSPTTDTTKGR